MWRGRPRSGLEELHAGCEELMAWVDVTFGYTHIAVTKNFVGSPHVDNLDQTFQYTISLGSFTKGGELCVEHRVTAHTTRGAVADSGGSGGVVADPMGLVLK